MNSSEAATVRKEILADFLAASAKIAQRLSWSLGRLARVMPLGEATIDKLSDEDEESLDALLHRFASLVTALQDNLACCWRSLVPWSPASGSAT